MRTINKDKIIKQWQEGFDKKFQLLDENVQEIRKVTERNISVKLWLGGPGKGGDKNLYSIR